MNHVDPELLAAWSDDTLSSEESRAVESHLADCSECRAVASAFGRTIEAEFTAGGAERRILAAARGTGAVPPHSRDEHAALRASVTKWILPFAATIVIGAGITWKYWPRPEVDAPQIATTAPPQPIAPPPVAPPAADVPVAESRFANPPVKTAPPKPATPAKPRGVPAQTTEGAAAPPARPITITPPVLAPIMPPPPPAAQPAPRPAMSADLRTMSAAETVMVAGGGGGAGRGGRGGGARMVAITSVPPIRWRVTSSNAVERSTDDGVTWSGVAIEGIGAQLTAGAAPNPTTCWLVGRMGVVLLSKNGEPFKRVPFPEEIDLASIVATSDLQATVIAADGRAFVTEDGGRTWRARF